MRCCRDVSRVSNSASTSPLSNSRSRNSRSLSARGNTADSALLQSSTSPRRNRLSRPARTVPVPEAWDAVVSSTPVLRSRYLRPRRSASPCGSSLHRRRTRGGAGHSGDHPDRESDCNQRDPSTACATAARQAFRREFVEVYQRNSPGTMVADRMGVGLEAVPERLSVHVVEIHFEDRRLTRVAHVPQPPFPACMFVRGPPDGEPLS